MADEEKRYTDWIRTQPCAVCGATFQVVPHHALYGTTYSPDEARPPKAIPNARKATSQRSHDYFSIPLCLKHHEPGVHQLGNFFAGKSRHWANDWEADQVSKLRLRYGMQCPERHPDDAVHATGKSDKRKRIGAGWTVSLVRDWLRREAPTRPGAVADALNELAGLLESDTL